MDNLRALYSHATRSAARPFFRRRRRLLAISQFQRATLSISNNIAECFERGSTNELIHFLYISRGSTDKVRSMLCVMKRMPAFAHLKSDTSDLKSQCESISRQTRAWTDSLQYSDIKGQRHLNNKTRQQYEQSQRKSNLWRRMEPFKQDHEASLNRDAAEEHRRASEENDDQ